MERVGDRYGKMEGYCLTGQIPQWAVVPMEGEEDVPTNKFAFPLFLRVCLAFHV
jgi:hypothetical protein